MRLKIASAVEGCLYSLLKTVPGRPSKYSNERREETDILSKTFIAARRADYLYLYNPLRYIETHLLHQISLYMQ